MPPRAEHLFFPIRKRTAALKIVQQSFFRARLRKILLSGCFSAIFIAACPYLRQKDRISLAEWRALYGDFEKTIRNQKFNTLLRKLEQEIPDSSWSADLEAGSDFKEGEARCSVRVFERYSMVGGNRLSLTLTMFQNADSPIRLSAITAGGSQAVFFKMNTLGEESFLDDVKDLLEEILEE